MEKNKIITALLLCVSAAVFCQNLESRGGDPDVKILSAYAKRNGCKDMPAAEFREKCISLFGIDLDNYQSNDMNIVIDRTEYSISKLGLFLKTFPESLFYQPWIDGVVTDQQAESMLANGDNGIGDKFIAYNKLLFYDDHSVESYFEKNPESVIEVVFNLNYESSEKMLANAIKLAKKYNVFDVAKFLFYNNPERGFRDKLISLYYNTCNNSIDNVQPFTDLIYKFSESFCELPYPQHIKDSCMVYMIKRLIDFDNEHTDKLSSVNRQFSYIYLSKFLDVDKKLYSRIIANKFYDSLKIRELLDYYKLLHSVRCYIHDQDGYTNLRKGAGLNTQIVKSLKSGESVIVVDCNGSWIRVKTKDGVTGYIHRSRLNISE